MKTIALVALFLVACTPVTPPVVDPEQWPASPEGACAHLEELGCPEAKPAPDGMGCSMLIRKMQRLVDPKLRCITEAADVTALRACGTVRCRE